MFCFIVVSLLLSLSAAQGAVLTVPKDDLESCEVLLRDSSPMFCGEILFGIQTESGEERVGVESVDGALPTDPRKNYLHARGYCLKDEGMTLQEREQSEFFILTMNPGTPMIQHGADSDHPLSWKCEALVISALFDSSRDFLSKFFPHFSGFSGRVTFGPQGPPEACAHVASPERSSTYDDGLRVGGIFPFLDTFLTFFAQKSKKFHSSDVPAAATFAASHKKKLNDLAGALARVFPFPEELNADFANQAVDTQLLRDAIVDQAILCCVNNKNAEGREFVDACTCGIADLYASFCPNSEISDSILEDWISVAGFFDNLRTAVVEALESAKKISTSELEAQNQDVGIKYAVLQKVNQVDDRSDEGSVCSQDQEEKEGEEEVRMPLRSAQTFLDESGNHALNIIKGVIVGYTTNYALQQVAVSLEGLSAEQCLKAIAIEDKQKVGMVDALKERVIFQKFVQSMDSICGYFGTSADRDTWSLADSSLPILLNDNHFLRFVCDYLLEDPELKSLRFSSLWETVRRAYCALKERGKVCVDANSALHLMLLAQGFDVELYGRLEGILSSHSDSIGEAGAFFGSSGSYSAGGVDILY
ncbi:MAG: hypothetical protein OXC30_06065 [Alphaproteobacteria bacterium]|nr:hypothetical protein [Alphaproteobacteria bacterium]